MLDPLMRRIIDPPLDLVAVRLAQSGVSANQLTLVGLLVGLACVPLLAVEAYGWALLCCLANRLLDGLDGAVARQRDATDFGGYADIVADLVFYAGVIYGFALARPQILPSRRRPDRRHGKHQLPCGNVTFPQLLQGNIDRSCDLVCGHDRRASTRGACILE